MPVDRLRLRWHSTDTRFEYDLRFVAASYYFHLSDAVKKLHDVAENETDEREGVNRNRKVACCKKKKRGGGGGGRGGKKRSCGSLVVGKP